jgi:predicted SprT family Zn-dependent metalloprotease
VLNSRCASCRHDLIASDSESESEEDAEQPAGYLLPALAALLPADYRPPPPRAPAAAAPPRGQPPLPAALSTSRAAAAAAFKKQREGLARELYAEFNARVFGGQLPAGLDIRWNNRLATTAGLTHYQRVRPADGAEGLTRYTAHIELSAKVLDEPPKLERTLLHEMCHVAAWLLDHTAKPPHGPVFRAWAATAMRALPHLDVTTCHAYEIFYAFRWQCGACAQEYGRHSNSIDVARKVCGQCRGRLTFLGRFTREGSPAKARAPTAFSQFVKDNFAAAKRECLPTTPASTVMKKLSARWAAERAGGQGGGGGGRAAEEPEVVNLFFAQLDL